MRVAVFGGSFDPPHLSHVLAVGLALSSGEVERVLVVPCHAHAFGKPLCAFLHRFEMARLAFALYGDRVELSRLEEEMGGISRTLDTVQRLAMLHPDWRMRLLVGGDILEEKDSWHRFDEIQRLAPLLVIARAGHGGQAASRIALPDVASREIRERVGRGESIAGLVPAAVADYIAAHGLYGEAP
jgi:nicotinate-nucleotide adenylyltransferase